MSIIGKIRQSAVLMNYGPGAIIDFRAPSTGAAVSVIAAGLEEWERKAAASGASPANLKRFAERRLCQKLQVSHFRMPPIAPDNPNNDDEVIPLVGVRFPNWLQCPKCNHIKPTRRWGANPGDPSRFCDSCSAGLPGQGKVYVVPVRFVLSCRNGHLDDFPWADWIHRQEGCLNQKDFVLSSNGPGLAGLVLSCPKCKQKRSMEYAFKGEAHEHRRCNGRRPWLPDSDEECHLKPVTIQRGASNLYFSQFESALVIPPWSDEVIQRLGFRWSEIERIESQEDRQKYIDIFWAEIQEDVCGIDKEAFSQFVEDKIEESQIAATGNLRWDEYRQFMLARGRSARRGDEFEVRDENPPARLPHLSHLIRVLSLREIRALRSFTRIEAYPGHPPVKRQFLSSRGINWLPAIEVRGEGIFVALEGERLKEWESRQSVRDRATKLNNYNESNVLNPDGGVNELSPELGARYLLLHALAHALMKQLSLQCGYSSASLRELIYAGEGDHDMAGLMIYTATSDSDGTLGGLQREGNPSRFEGMFIEAIRANEWCASDPLCIQGLVSSAEASSLACCHSCLLSPETSCQDYNRFLDRAMLVGLPDDPSVGFFAELLERDL